MNIRDLIKGKVSFDRSSDGAIFDESGNHIADARGWGRFQKEQNGLEKHDFLAEFIAEAINFWLGMDDLEKRDLGKPFKHDK